MCVLLSEMSCPSLTLRLHGYHGHHVLQLTHPGQLQDLTIETDLLSSDLHVLSGCQQVSVYKRVYQLVIL